MGGVGILPPGEPALDLIEWVRHVLEPQDLRPARHHLALLEQLGRLTAGEIDRLMVLMPPGSAKSTMVSILFPAWWFARHPRTSVIAASHTGELATHFGRQVRNLVTDYQDTLGYGLCSYSRAAARWQTSISGEYFAAGIRGPITGRRADLAIVDDPVKSMLAAESLRERERLWDWFRSDLITRLKPRGRIVLVMTRWHEDDLAGRLLLHTPQEWTVLRLPALAELDDPLGRAPGEPLWPEWEDEKALIRKRDTVGERVWSALYQQSPRPRQGGLFKVARIGFVDAGCALQGPVVRAWDLAATAATAANDPDWTVGIKMQQDGDGRWCVLDVVRMQGCPGDVEAAIKAAAKADGNATLISMPEDPGQAGKAQSSYLASKLGGFNVTFTRETGSKVVRAVPLAAQVDAGNLVLLRANWNHTLIEELRDFPYGRKDDQVDALVRAFNTLTGRSQGLRSLPTTMMAR